MAENDIKTVKDQFSETTLQEWFEARGFLILYHASMIPDWLGAVFVGLSLEFIPTPLGASDLRKWGQNESCPWAHGRPTRIIADIPPARNSYA